MGRAAFLGEANSPSTSSLLISKPTNRKKITIRPSSIHCLIEYLRWIDSFSKPTCVESKVSKLSPRGELATIKAKTTQTINNIPPPVLDSKNSLKERRLISFDIVV